MHGNKIFLDTETYNEFIQRQSCVDEIYYHHPLIIFKLISTNPMEKQSQNIPNYDSAHIEILNDGGDEDTQKMRKKFDLFKVHIKKVEKLDRTKIIVCNYCSKEFKWSKSRSYDTYKTG